MRVPLFLSGLLLAAHAFAATPEETVQKAMSVLVPGVEVDAVQDSQVPGFYEAVAGGQFVYVTKDGRYLVDGNAYDVRARKDLTESSRAKARREALAKVGPEMRIDFVPKAPVETRHTVTVFTDIDCPFCRHFHEQIEQFNAKGIAVNYLFYPLTIHPDADVKAEAVWCTKDRASAFTAAMAGQDPGKASCPNPVAELTQLARSLGISGTPTMLAPDGSQVASQIAMSPDRLAAELDRIASAADAAR